MSVLIKWGLILACAGNYQSGHMSPCPSPISTSPSCMRIQIADMNTNMDALQIKVYVKNESKPNI